ncbi:MAG: bifunctional 4-hydroxy-2-oxoglutarate aldolase/2-dehydro-3-deoxy-phosphogluconate aldolase [Anaerolineae bacterium]|nr:bifunctional 4-hydroxy-2-oxoglutarate aldolase/2-dehydro-3-deoxy-phosphogluconate aldolase [Anaerolineae bacterium]
MNEVLNQIEQFGVVPVVAIDDADHAPDLGRALLDGGLPCAEITFRTAAAAEAIRRIASNYPEMLVGAGTVLTVEQAQKAADAGAQFIVTPGFDAAVVDWCIEREIPVTPGVMTPTEINMALNKGLNVLKFFPAEAAGGIQTLKAIGGPYGGVRFIPTGGISPANLSYYLRLPMVVACGGSWLVKKQMIASGHFDQIVELTAQAVEIVREARAPVAHAL